jgi:Transposase
MRCCITPTVNGSGPVPGRPDSHSDGPFGRLAPQGDSARPDPHSNRPDVSFPRPVGRPETPCGGALPRRCLCEKGLTSHGLVTVLSTHSVPAKPFMHGQAGSWEWLSSKDGASHRRRRDTHKDLHVAAVVDEQDRVLGTHSFATTRQGYRQMLAWMRSLGDLQRIGVESTGSYGAGLLRFMQQAGVAVLEVTTPDKQDRRRRGKNDDLDAQNAAHAAFAGQRTVTPRSRDGMIESLRVLVACRKTAVAEARP